MLKSDVHALHYSKNLLLHSLALHCVHDNTNRDCSTLAPSVFNSHSVYFHIISLPSPVSTSLNHFVQLPPPSCLSVHYMGLKSREKDRRRRCVCEKDL